MIRISILCFSYFMSLSWISNCFRRERRNWSCPNFSQHLFAGIHATTMSTNFPYKRGPNVSSPNSLHPKFFKSGSFIFIYFSFASAWSTWAIWIFSLRLNARLWVFRSLLPTRVSIPSDRPRAHHTLFEKEGHLFSNSRDIYHSWNWPIQV